MPLDIGGYQATDILCITDRNGVQILYTPGETDVFHVLPPPHDLHWWLLMQNNHAENRARFMAHFPLAAQQQDERQHRPERHDRPAVLHLGHK